MREGIVLYDREGREIFAVANVDARASEEVAELHREFPGLEEEFYARSGQTFALGALPRLLWVRRHRPEIYEKAAAMNMISDWVLTRLSGEIASEPSNAGTTGIFSLTSRQWEPEMAERVGLRGDIFPPVVESGTVLGKVTLEAAEATGLAAGTPVVAGGGDVQLGSAGLGIVRKGDSAILGGSFWQQIVNVPAGSVDPEMNIRINPHVVPGLSQAEGITFFTGLIMRWFRDQFCIEESARAAEEGIDPYTWMEREAARVPPGSLGIVPIFSDTMKYGRWYHAAPSFLNLPLEGPVKAAMFRALEENAAIVSALNLERIFDFAGVESDTLVFAGGAARGELWPRILADTTGREVRIPEVTEATALGGAFAAGVGVGIYGSLEEAADRLVRWHRSYTPDRENHRLYREAAERWREIYDTQLSLVDRNLTTSMWRAPGL
jgi:autoinducer 2 (AI-2) kinase